MNYKFYIWYICITICFIYVTFIDGLFLYLQYLGAPMVLLHPYIIGLDDASKVEIIPQIFRLSYIIISYTIMTIIAFKLKILSETSNKQRESK